MLHAAQILHGHEIDHQACPSREMLRALALARLWVVLLPRKACSLVLLEYVVD